MEEYQKGQRISVPRDMRPMLEEIISRRERYESEAFRAIGEAFGYGGKDIGDDQQWMFAIDKEKQVAFCFLKEDKEAKRIKEIPIDQATVPIMKLEAARPSNDIVVRCIEMLIPGAERYHWNLKPKEMEIEIIARKQKPKMDLSAVENQGGVQ